MQAEPTLSIQLSPLNQLTLSRTGARILLLVLNGTTLIRSPPDDTSLGVGSYLMYPWVNRLRQPQPPYEPVFRDGNGYPLHGVVVNAPCVLRTVEREGGVEVVAEPEKLQPEGLPVYRQVFVLEEGRLTVKMEFGAGVHLPVCFGYHPYLQINQENIRDLHIETNITTNVKLDEKTLLPVVPFVETEVQISTQNQYDDLFKHTQGDTYLRLGKPNGPTVEISSLDMKYWQIYTPPDGKRIAVEPMTFMGNLYELYSEEKYGNLPSKASFTISIR